MLRDIEPYGGGIADIWRDLRMILVR